MSLVTSRTNSSPKFAERGGAESLGLPTPTQRFEPVNSVTLCYTLMHVAEAAGIRDLADGEYLPGDKTLEDGIQRQLNYLLDEVGCTRPGFRLLEIGCGYGRLLQMAKERGAKAVGVNVSPEQVRYCRDQELEVYCCTYRDLLNSPDWQEQFDGVIANGSLEHWVQPEDVQAGRMNEICHESFAIAHQMIDPDTADAHLVTTALHVKDPLDPDELLRPWYRQPRGSARRMFSLLQQWFGGYYPVFGQLEASARPYFSLEREVDGTLGYKIASQYRMARMRRALFTKPQVIWGILKGTALHPKKMAALLEGYFIEQAWDWQFRGAEPPTRLLRQTWKRNPQANSTMEHVS